MNAGTKLAAYGLLLAAALGGGAAVGAAAGPIDVGSDRPPHTTTHEGSSPAMTESTDAPAGTLISHDGYTFEPETRTLAGGEFAFTITGPDGHPVVAFDDLHERELHLIVASRDLQHYAHLHPTRDADGRWTVELPQLAPGSYRAFVDFRPTGSDQHTLGADLTVPGAPQPGGELVETTTDEVDGFHVTLERDDRAAEVTLTVRRDGEVVTTEPYLGAAGHLVALRDGDLAYLHVHPVDEMPKGPVRFAVEFPSTGRYGLFFDFQVDGVVHTARIIVDAAAASAGHGHSDH